MLSHKQQDLRLKFNISHSLQATNPKKCSSDIIYNIPQDARLKCNILVLQATNENKRPLNVIYLLVP